MGIFRYDCNYSAPIKGQRERDMRGDYQEHTFGNDGEILLVLYNEAAYLKDKTDGVRILFTGMEDKQKVQDQLRRLLHEQRQKVQHPDQFRTRGIGNNRGSLLHTP